MQKDYRALKKCSAILLILLLCSTTAFSMPRAQTLQRAKDFKHINVKVLKKIPLVKGYHEGLFYDGENIWVNNGQKGKIWVINPVSGAHLFDIEPVSTFTETVTSMPDGSLFLTDWDTEKLYRVNLVGNSLVPQVFEVSFAPAHPAGAVCVGNKIYVIVWYRTPVGTRFRLLEICLDGTVSRIVTIKNINEPAHMAWDGKNLWITSWYNPFIYKIDINDWQIAGSFRSPVSKTTGIVWDGKYLWLTGTYSDLYQIEVISP